MIDILFDGICGQLLNQQYTERKRAYPVSSSDMTITITETDTFNGYSLTVNDESVFHLCMFNHLATRFTDIDMELCGDVDDGITIKIGTLDNQCSYRNADKVDELINRIVDYINKITDRKQL